uniref:Peptidase A1 domain-containing protein n=1 Tax=Panagrellus redivivus TaxID=6233 RepID=A0A7E4VNW8_PANRE
MSINSTVNIKDVYFYPPNATLFRITTQMPLNTPFGQFFMPKALEMTTPIDQCDSYAGVLWCYNNPPTKKTTAILPELVLGPFIRASYFWLSCYEVKMTAIAKSDHFVFKIRTNSVYIALPPSQ